MSHTNSTPNYGLPQFITTDKPFWLTDVNSAYLAIDTGIDAAKDAADAAQNDATQALTDAGTAITNASAADTKATGSIASIAPAFDATATYNIRDLVMYNSLLYLCTVAVTTPGPWTGASNWQRVTIAARFDSMQPKYDDDLQTNSHWVVPAINEVNSKITINGVLNTTKTPNAAGYVDINFSDIGVTARPRYVHAVCTSDNNCFIRYDWDNSNSRIALNFTNRLGNNITSGTYRIAIIAVQ